MAGAGRCASSQRQLEAGVVSATGPGSVLTRGRSARARGACVYLCTPFSPPRHPTSPQRLSLSPSPFSPPLQELAQGMRFLSQQVTAKLGTRAGPTPEGQGPPGSLAGPWPRCPRSQSWQRARPTPRCTSCPTFSKPCFCKALTTSIFATTTTKSKLNPSFYSAMLRL